MPNLYKRTLGKRKYHDFSKEDLEKALREIRSKKMSMVEAAEHYNISKSTLWRKLKNLHMKKHGGQTVLTKMEEDNISEIILFAADWGYPLSRLHTMRIHMRMFPNLRHVLIFVRVDLDANIHTMCD
jgi:predicted transcriptional regulator